MNGRERELVVTVSGRWNLIPSARADERLKLSLVRFRPFKYAPKPCRPRFDIHRVKASGQAAGTVAHARDELYRRVRKGETVECEGCDRNATLRPRALTPIKIKFLLKLIRLQLWSPGPKTVNEVLGIPKEEGSKASTDAAYLSHWGLIEKLGGNMYLATADALRFVHGRMLMPYSVKLFNQHKFGWSTKLVTIYDCVGADTSELDAVQRMLDDKTEG